MTERLGPGRAIFTVVLAGAIVTYGGVSLFVAFFVLVPMAHQLFHTAGLPNRLIPAAITLGTSTFTMSALPGTECDPDTGLRHDAAVRARSRHHCVCDYARFRLWWLGRAAARRSSSSDGGLPAETVEHAVEDETIRQRATTAREFDPPEVRRGQPSHVSPPITPAGLPLLVVVSVNV